MDRQLDLREALKHINCAACNYQEWINIGMALKAEGYSVSDWEVWSATDPARYHFGDCAKHWASFQGSANPVTGGTIVKMAMDAGWRPSGGDSDDPGHEISWDDSIGGKNDKLKVVDSAWMEEKDIPAPPKDFDGPKELTRYLQILFDGSENVGYVTTSYTNQDGRKVPTKGNYDRTADQLIEALSACKGDIGAVLGDYDPTAGAWIRFNPLDGHGVKNENVTEYRYALVESDTLELGKQYSLMLELRLPIAVMVHSGKKSIHAIIRIDARDYNEYRSRVDYLYTVCEKNGMELDRQNRNPSRLSRMPGVMRNGKPQYIIAENVGCASFEEWQDYIEGVNDELPEIENLKDTFYDLPPLAPELIKGVLRHGHKMLLVGPSKAGKSYALIELCISIAEGIPWMGFECDKGRVLYINLELDDASCKHRFKDVYDALGIEPANIQSIDFWNLRGRSCPMDKLTPKLIRRAKKKPEPYAAIIIDPIYKVITGDENAADQMSAFCNQFDKLCTELQCSAIYSHHHSKGSQGQKRSMDRASGSGVFARDPDALIDMIELPIPWDTKAGVLIPQMKLRRYQEWLDKHKPNWRDLMSENDQEDFVKLSAQADSAELEAAIEAEEERIGYLTGWRIEGTLREFAPMQPRRVLFDYPVHRNDTEGILKGLKAEGERRSIEKAQGARRMSAEEKTQAAIDLFIDGVQSINFGDPPTVDQMIDWYAEPDRDGKKVTRKTIKNRAEKAGYTIDKNNDTLIPADGND